jgi:uncharacterized protein (TIGR01244 family)
MLNNNKILDMNLKNIDKDQYISGQITLDILEELGNIGFSLIINNRPDGEELNQVSSKELKIKSESFGINYFDIPFASDTLSKQKIKNFSDLIRNNNKKSLFFCRSGARSSVIWGLASVIHLGKDLDRCMKNIDKAGYDSSILPNMVEYFKNN